MKKFIAIAIAVLTVFSFTTVAFAENTTTLTTTVPDAEYTLNIPADQEIPFGATSTDIGAISVTDSKYFAKGKNLQVSVVYDDFKSNEVSTTIPFVVKHYATWDGNGEDSKQEVKEKSLKSVASGNAITFYGKSDGTVYEYISTKVEGFIGSGYDDGSFVRNYLISIASTDWGKALAGDYTATITFTAEVVAE